MFSLKCIFLFLYIFSKCVREIRETHEGGIISYCSRIWTSVIRGCGSLSVCQLLGGSCLCPLPALVQLLGSTWLATLETSQGSYICAGMEPPYPEAVYLLLSDAGGGGVDTLCRRVVHFMPCLGASPGASEAGGWTRGTVIAQSNRALFHVFRSHALIKPPYPDTTYLRFAGMGGGGLYNEE